MQLATGLPDVDVGVAAKLLTRLDSASYYELRAGEVSGRVVPKRLLWRKCLFRQVGWPTKVPIPARRSFVAEVHEKKQQHLKDMVQRSEIPLRAGKRAIPALLARVLHMPAASPVISIQSGL